MFSKEKTLKMFLQFKGYKIQLFQNVHIPSPYTYVMIENIYLYFTINSSMIVNDRVLRSEFYVQIYISVTRELLLISQVL